MSNSIMFIDSNRKKLSDLENFTDREDAIAKFHGYLELQNGSPLKVLNFYGVGGIGKSMLARKLADELTQGINLPWAKFDLSRVGSPTEAAIKTLTDLRTILRIEHHLSFPHFDLTLAVIKWREGGSAPPLAPIDPSLNDAWQFVTTLSPISVTNLGNVIQRKIEGKPKLAEFVRRLGGTEEVTKLWNRLLVDDGDISSELIKSFAQDLKDGLPASNGRECRCVLFFDTYESLWKGQEGGLSAQAALIDLWVRDLADYCLQVGALPVILGRESLLWGKIDTNWNAKLDQQIIGGLAERDALDYLSKCGVGLPSDQEPTILQRAIVNCCNQELNGEISCLPFYLMLCAEIVLNERATPNHDPKPELFTGIPSDNIASELANKFLSSLHNDKMQYWVEALCLTPVFDEQAALALDNQKQFYNGIPGWKRLTLFSFMEQLPDGLYRFHKTMRDALRVRVSVENTKKLHELFQEHWAERNEQSLSYYHAWSLDPSAILASWSEKHETALTGLRIEDARELLELWDYIQLDDFDLKLIGDELWARTHGSLAIALYETPKLEMGLSIIVAIAHYLEALRVYTKDRFPQDWAATQNNLANAYSNLPTGDREKNLEKAIDCYENALRVYTEDRFPQQWAATQNNLAVAYRNLPTGDRGKNIEKAIDCYENALRVYTEDRFPQQWAETNYNCGLACRDLFSVSEGEVHLLRRAIQCFNNAERGYNSVGLSNDAKKAAEMVSKIQELLQNLDG